MVYLNLDIVNLKSDILYLILDTKEECMSYFSERIKKLRVDRSLTQKEVASEIGISQGNYSGLENDKFEPSLSTLEALSRFYDEFIDTLVRPIRIIEDEELTYEEKLLLYFYRRLNDHDRIDVKLYIEHKTKSYKIESDNV